jgi:hypothetical protein
MLSIITKNTGKVKDNGTYSYILYLSRLNTMIIFLDKYKEKERPWQSHKLVIHW